MMQRPLQSLNTREFQRGNMLTLTILLSLAVSSFSCNFVNNSVLEALKPAFGLDQVNLVTNRKLPTKTAINIAVAQFKLDVTVHIYYFDLTETISQTPSLVIQEPLIFCSDLKDDLKAFEAVVDKNNWATKKPIILWANSDFQELGSVVRLNQRVYYVASDSGLVSETYTVNGKTVRNVLGKVIPKGNEEMEYIPTTLGRLEFKKRRSNFHGYHVVAMTNAGPESVSFVKEYQKIAKYHENNQTFDVTNYALGPYISYLNILANEFNFTYSLYRRLDGNWGGVDANGKLIGMVANLVEGSAEMIATVLTMTPWRNERITYLPGITSSKSAIAIRSETREGFSWTTFSKPFTFELWLVLLFVATILAIWLFLSNNGLKKVTI